MALLFSLLTWALVAAAIIYYVSQQGQAYAAARKGLEDASPEEVAYVRERAYMRTPTPPPTVLFPKRVPGAPLIYPETKRKLLPWLAGAVGLLLLVGFLGKSLIPVLLMAPVLLLIAVGAVKVLEREQRLLDAQVHEMAGVAGEELYVPEDWFP